jgi:hypothetical protein
MDLREGEPVTSRGPYELTAGALDSMSADEASPPQSCEAKRPDPVRYVTGVSMSQGPVRT